MEPDDHHPIPEKPSSDGDKQGKSEVKSRSYGCSFCKRGFSNAQALGGHMNVHRKDKAKLKKQTSTSSQTQPSLEIHHHKVPSLWQLMETKSGEEQSSYTNWPWKVTLTPQDDASSGDENDLVPVTQLPLFADSPIISKETRKPDGQVLGETTAERDLPSSHQGLSSELDLELRLGPDPEDSSATTGTRNFF